jgi:phospholipid/cholesterol/gamma-HCH transport system substrate-binding protein
MTLKDRLRFSAEVWDFSRPDLNAHAKVLGRYYLSPSVFVMGGWDDFLNTKAKQDSLFVGAGVRWGDEDIKYLAGSVPTR